MFSKEEVISMCKSCESMALESCKRTLKSYNDENIRLKMQLRDLEHGAFEDSRITALEAERDHFKLANTELRATIAELVAAGKAVLNIWHQYWDEGECSDVLKQAITKAEGAGNENHMAQS